MKTNIRIILIIVITTLAASFASCSKSVISPNGVENTDVYTITRITSYANFYLIEATGAQQIGFGETLVKFKIISFRTPYKGEEQIKVKQKYRLDLAYIYEAFHYYLEQNYPQPPDFTVCIGDATKLRQDIEVYIAGDMLKLKKGEPGILFCAQNLSGLYIVDDNASAKEEVKNKWEYWRRPRNIPYLTIDSVFKLRAKEHYDSFLKIRKEIVELKEQTKGTNPQ